MTDVATAAPVDANERFCIMDFRIGGERRRVYLLNPGDHFERFGGSSRGLVVRKTASLIVSETQGGCRSDMEFNLADKEAWERILYAYIVSKKVPGAGQ